MRFTKTQAMTLAPFDQAAAQWLLALHSTEPVEMEVVHERDMVNHRRIMSQIAELAKAAHMSSELLRAELLMETGNFVVLGELFGKTMISVNSMSRHSMKDHELHTFWEEARAVIRSKILERVNDAAERQRLADMLSLQTA
jgi:hypothetical protein